MTEAKTFKIQDIISCTTGILIGKMEGVYQVMSHLACRPVFTHEIPALAERCQQAILAEHPQLSEENPPKGQPEKLPNYIKYLVERYGEELPISNAISTAGSHDLLKGKEVITVHT